MYRWVITRDVLHEQNTGGSGDLPDRVGTRGPRQWGNKDFEDNPVKWQAYDDDKNLYYEGMLYGDYDGFEPLDDFAMPDAGATAIKIDGRWL